MRALALLAVLALLLAGCSAKDDEDGADPTPTGTDPTTGPPGTSRPTTGPPGTSPAPTTGPPGTSPPPTGSKDPDRSIQFSAPNLVGSAPANLTFTLDATGDKATGSWKLEYGDTSAAAEGKGSDLPATLTHRYTAAGNFTARYTFTYADGEALQKTLNVTVRSGAAAGPAGFKSHYDAIIANPAPLGNVPAEPFLDAAYDNGANGTFVVYYDFTVEPKAKSFAFANTPGPSCVDVDLYLRLPDGTYASAATESAAESMTLTPAAGDYVAFVLLWAGAACQVGVDLELKY